MSSIFGSGSPVGRITAAKDTLYIDTVTRIQYKQQRGPTGDSWTLFKSPVDPQDGGGFTIHAGSNVTFTGTSTEIIINAAGGGSSLNPLGNWNANTNNPTLQSGVGTLGDIYKVTVAGNTLLDDNDVWAVGDDVLFVNGIWNRIVGGNLSLLIVGLTTIAAGTNNRLLYDNNGILGELIIGTGLTITGSTLNSTALLAVDWGDIGGTLSDQTDLWSELTARPTGSGILGQVAFWDTTHSITGDNSFLYDTSTGLTTTTNIHTGANMTASGFIQAQSYVRAIGYISTDVSYNIAGSIFFAMANSDSVSIGNNSNLLSPSQFQVSVGIGAGQQLNNTTVGNTNIGFHSTNNAVTEQYTTSIGFRANASINGTIGNTAIGAQSNENSPSGDYGVTVGYRAYTNNFNKAIVLGVNTGGGSPTTKATTNNQFVVGGDQMTSDLVDRWRIAGIDYIMPSTQGIAGQVLGISGVVSGVGTLYWTAGGGGGGGVTSVSVTTANGFAGTVATATTTPAITIKTNGFIAKQVILAGASNAITFDTNLTYGNFASGYLNVNNGISIGGNFYTTQVGSDIYFGNGVILPVPGTVNINATGGQGGNATGYDLGLAAGKSTGNGTSANIIFYLSNGGSSGSSLRTLYEAGRFDGASGNFMIGGSKFQVDVNGNIVKLNNIVTNFPNSLGTANYFLKTDGSGNFSWAAVSAPLTTGQVGYGVAGSLGSSASLLFSLTASPGGTPGLTFGTDLSYIYGSGSNTNTAYSLYYHDRHNVGFGDGYNEGSGTSYMRAGTNKITWYIDGNNCMDINPTGVLNLYAASAGGGPTFNIINYSTWYSGITFSEGGSIYGYFLRLGSAWPYSVPLREYMVFENVSSVGGIRFSTNSTDALDIDINGVISSLKNTFKPVAGTTSIAPLIFTAGTNLTSATDGAIEYNGVNYFATRSTTREKIWTGLTGVSAPTPQTLLALPLMVYGSGTINQVLGTPDGWLSINDNGTIRKVPYYN